MSIGRYVRRPPAARSSRAQALDELALVMPVLVGIIAVLFQFGILFIAYLSVVHMTRDVGRFVAVHPDIVDGSPGGTTPPCTSSPPVGSLWNHVCADVPSVLDKTRIKDVPLVTPQCASLTSGHCTGRTTGSEIHIQMQYDPTTIIFLPSDFKLGPWLEVAIPAAAAFPAYDYYVMVEPH